MLSACLDLAGMRDRVNSVNLPEMVSSRHDKIKLDFYNSSKCRSHSLKKRTVYADSLGEKLGKQQRHVNM